MSSGYDKYYQTENLFGEPYPELIAFLKTYSMKGRLLDLGCGQGRDAIAIARLGYEVVGIDNSAIGIAQMNQRAAKEKLILKGIVADIYLHEDFSNFEFILLDSMFHFTKKDEQRETDFIKKIITGSAPETVVTFCIQNSKKKLAILEHTLNLMGSLNRIHEISFQYQFKDDATGHVSTTDYKLIAIKKAP
jgi:SAM-dependent methyltransferase